MSTLGFAAEWYDPIAREVTKLYLKFFLEDGTIELLKNGVKQSTFLKRIHYPQVTLQDMYIGSTVSVYNRVITLTDYANSGTRDYMMSRETHFLCIVKTRSIHRLGKLFEAVDKHRLSIGRTRTANISLAGYDVDSGDIVFEFVGIEGQNDENFIADVEKLGLEVFTIKSTTQEITEVMSNFSGVTIPDNCTLCFLKPHILRNGEVGDCLGDIVDAGFKIEALLSLHLSMDIVEFMFEVYRGIYPNYHKMVEHMCSGPCLAVMISSASGNSVAEFRNYCGPLDPQLSKVVRPKSLRARFGIDSTYNVLHCTDLPDDGTMECEYVFKTLASL